MREIQTSIITDSVADLCMQANYNVPKDVLNAFKESLKKEESETGKDIINQLIENAQIASEEQVPICQDTGVAVVFVEMGQYAGIVGGNLNEAINAGVRKGYADGYLRKSILGHPLQRENTGDNTPAVIYTDIVPGDNLKIIVMPKGGGCENMSAVKMLKPSEGVEGVKKFVVDTVKAAGPNPCPPIIIGVGIGGTFEKCALIAKKSLLRPIGQHSPIPDIAGLEDELLTMINNTGIGPQGLGGRVTALAVKIEIFPCHLASLPCAVNIDCHATRHASIVL